MTTIAFHSVEVSRPSASKPPRSGVPSAATAESQDYGRRDEQGDKEYEGHASWVIGNCCMLHPKWRCGGGSHVEAVPRLTCRFGSRRCWFWIGANASDITWPTPADCQCLTPQLTLCLWIPYSTHIRYTEQPECIGTLDAAGDDGGGRITTP